RWVTEAVYKIINYKDLADKKGSLAIESLKEILDIKKYPPRKYDYIIELMKKFELCYSVENVANVANVANMKPAAIAQKAADAGHVTGGTVLIPDLLEVAEPEFQFDYDNSLKYVLQYDFLPKSVMARFIVKRHREIKENLRWRTGVVLENKTFNSTAVVKADEGDKKILIDVTGNMKRDMFAGLRLTFNEINDSFEKLDVKEMVPLTDDKSVAVPYNELLGLVEMGVAQYKSGALRKTYDINRLLDVFVSPGDRKKDSDRIIKVEGDLHLNLNQSQNLDNIVTQITDVKQDVNVDIDVDIDIDINIELPALQADFEALKELMLAQNPHLQNKLQAIEDTLDKIHAGSKKEEMNTPMNKLFRFLKKLGTEDSEYRTLIDGAEKGVEYAQKLGKGYNKVAQYTGMPQIPNFLL
ncbi:MAG: hypothetical protein GY757_10985, partial [bacterium]|nr:hypothetical protein [bacterium]